MTYQLSSVRSNQAGFEHLGDLAKATKHLFADELELDMSRATSFDTNMAAPLGVILARVADELNSVRIVSVPVAVRKRLIESKFLTRYRYCSRDGEGHAVMPFQRFRLADEGALEEYVQRLLTNRPLSDMSERMTHRFRAKVFEVYQNAVIHSESEVGVFVCGRSFSSSSLLHLTIADGGIGIRDSVRRYFKNHRIGSVPALKWALKRHNTTKRGSQPGGLGLQFIQNFTNLNQGRLRIASRFALYEYHCGREICRKMTADFPGTAVTIEIDTADPGRCVLPLEVS